MPSINKALRRERKYKKDRYGAKIETTHDDSKGKKKDWKKARKQKEEIRNLGIDK